MRDGVLVRLQLLAALEPFDLRGKKCTFLLSLRLSLKCAHSDGFDKEMGFCRLSVSVKQ